MSCWVFVTVWINSVRLQSYSKQPNTVTLSLLNFESKDWAKSTRSCIPFFELFIQLQNSTMHFTFFAFDQLWWLNNSIYRSPGPDCLPDSISLEAFRPLPILVIHLGPERTSSGHSSDQLISLPALRHLSIFNTCLPSNHPLWSPIFYALPSLL